MAKKKIKKKQLKKIHIFAPALFIGVFLVTFFLEVLLTYTTISRPMSFHPMVKAHAQENLIADLLPTPTATPSPTLTPTPEIPAGFCLYAPVIMYHHIQPMDVAKANGQGSLTVDPGYFDQQMAYIAASGYRTISAEELVNAVRAHTQLGKVIVITLDDGYEDNYQYAFQILKKYNLIGNIMVATGLLGGSGANTYFTWDQLQEMVNSGHIFAYDHTWSHYSTGSGNSDKDQYEIMTAKGQLESHLGKTQTVFAYPYGSGQTNGALIQRLQQDGFAGAFSTIGGSYQCESYIYTLRRIHIGNAPLSAYGL